MQIIFLSCTKCLWLLQYVNKLLVRHKKIGPAQNIFGPVKGQDMCIFRFWMLNLKIQSNRMFVYSCCFCCIFQKHSIKAIFFWLGLTPLIGDPPWYCIVSPKLQTNKQTRNLCIFQFWMLNLKIQSNLLFLLLHISKACNQSHLFSAANCQMNLSKVQKIFHHLFFVAKGPDPSSFGSVIAPRSAPWGLNIFVIWSISVKIIILR